MTILETIIKVLDFLANLFLIVGFISLIAACFWKTGEERIKHLSRGVLFSLIWVWYKLTMINEVSLQHIMNP